MSKLHGDRHIEREQSRSRLMVIAGIVRVIGWTLLGICLALGLLHVGGFTWAKSLALSIPFVALISIYANWSTDIDATTAAYAALVAANAHADAEGAHLNTSLDLDQLERDLDRLAGLRPGLEGRTLAARIYRRLGG